MEWMIAFIGCFVVALAHATLAAARRREIDALVSAIRDGSVPQRYQRALTEAQDGHDAMSAENERLREALSSIEYFEAVDISSRECWLVIADGCYEIPLGAVFLDGADADLWCSDQNELWESSDCEKGMRCYSVPGRVSQEQVVVWNNGVDDPPEKMPDLHKLLEREEASQ